MSAAKRATDLIVAGIGLVVLAPVMVAVAVAVKCRSPGPILYRGVRTGLGGRPFRILKFRTMVVDAERLGGTTTAAADPRLSPIGRALRKCKLDELPQLVNVLRGEMSLVGPRPEVAEYTDAYSQEERLILSVKPGITDLASLEFVDLQEHVGGESADQVYRERVLPAKNALRLRYVRDRSFLGDLVILGQTAWRLTTRLMK